MIYKVFLEFAQGKSKGHEYRFESRVKLVEHLTAMAKEDNFALASNVVFMADNKVILSVPANTPAKKICNAFIKNTRGVGKPLAFRDAVTTSIYMEKEVRELLKRYGDGSASKGFNLLIKQIDDPELQAILAKTP